MLTLNLSQNSSTLATSLILASVGSLIFSDSSQAAIFELDLLSWTSYGDVSLNYNQAYMTNAYTNGLDDPINYNISGNNPIEAFELESLLGLENGALGLDSGDTSGITKTFTVSSETEFTFQWTFLTNHAQFESDRSDYAFVVINDSILFLANTDSDLTSPGLNGFERQTQNIFSYTLLPDVDYTITIGVTDVGDYVTSSALLVQPVPEPLTLLGVGTAMAFGTWFKRKLN